VFFAGTSVFLVGSLLCGCAWDMGGVGLVPGGFQGIGASAIQPIATTIIGDIYTPVEAGADAGLRPPVCMALPRSSARHWAPSSSSMSAGPWCSGSICRSAPPAFVMFGLFLHEHREPRRHRIDYLGSALLMLGVGAPMFAPGAGRQRRQPDRRSTGVGGCGCSGGAGAEREARGGADAPREALAKPGRRSWLSRRLLQWRADDGGLRLFCRPMCRGPWAAARRPPAWCSPPRRSAGPSPAWRRGA